MLVAGRFRRAIDEYSVFVFPLPVGPGDEHHAPGLLDRRFETRERLGLEPERAHVEHQRPAVEQAQHQLLAEQRGQRRHPEVDVPRSRRRRHTAP